MHVNLILQDFGRKVAQTSGKHYKLDRIRLMPTFIEQARQIFLEKKQQVDSKNIVVKWCDNKMEICQVLAQSFISSKTVAEVETRHFPISHQAPPGLQSSRKREENLNILKSSFL